MLNDLTSSVRGLYTKLVETYFFFARSAALRTGLRREENHFFLFPASELAGYYQPSPAGTAYRSCSRVFINEQGVAPEQGNPKLSRENSLLRHGAERGGEVLRSSLGWRSGFRLRPPLRFPAKRLRLGSLGLGQDGRSRGRPCRDGLTRSLVKPNASNMLGFILCNFVFPTE